MLETLRNLVKRLFELSGVLIVVVLDPVPVDNVPMNGVFKEGIFNVGTS